ncbi:MAG: hypothetical protein QM817_41660 [Archangium sp.]
MRRLLLLAVPVALVTCSPNPPDTGTLRVVVQLESGTRSACVRLTASGAIDRQSMAVEVKDRTRLVFGVAQLAEPTAVDLQAIGYADPACSMRTTPFEETQLLSAQFGTPTPEVELTLRVVGAQTDGGPGIDGGNDAGSDDAGLDGGGGTDGGGPDGGGLDGSVDFDRDGYTSDVDCNDMNVAIHPNAVEQCGNQLDDDCDFDTDCADSACDMQQCRVGSGNACVQDACAETNCNDGLDNDFDGNTDCADVDCAGAVCGTAGRCVNLSCQAPRENGLCADGVDNDNDTFTDCADPDCPAGSACSDGDACTTNDQCNGTTCGSGATLTCNVQPGACFASTGTCQRDAGCVYPVNTTAMCDDGLFCTANACGVDGGCLATPKICNTPPAGGCFAMTGACVETDGGPCSYLPLAQGTMNACSDSDNCTVGDACDGDGGCTPGTRTTCTAPGECFTSNGCNASGQCQFSLRTGSCSGGGSCAADGGCVTSVIFPYTPSNFTEPQLPVSAGALNVNCATTLVTESGDGGIDWTTCSGGPAKPPFTVINVGGTPTVLLFADTLVVGNALRTTGARPVIIAVRTTVNINSTINASSANDGLGAGGHTGCNAVERGGDGEASGNPETGGGAGGGAFGTNGGSGAAGSNGGPRGDAGVVMNTAQTLTPLRGGCRGGSGGRVSQANGGFGGRGGGAVQISAGSTITFGSLGSVQANGQGGQGGNSGQRTGGGGGGSGGAILLEGTTLTMGPISVLAANGGAGAEGSGGQLNGGDGQDGPVSAAQATCNSTGTGCGGNGGDGASRMGGSANGLAPFGANCASNPPGGGGGGGVGRIRLNLTSCSFDNLAIVSPASTSATAGCVR